MLLIRNLIYWLILVLSLLLMFPLIVCATPFPKGANHVSRWWIAIMMWSLKHIIGLHYRVQGQDNIPSQPAIICSKHQSGWETLALQEIFPMQVYVAKRELFNIPVFGWGLRLVKTIGIDRGNGNQANQQLAQQGAARKQEGFWITIFPEGTRVPAGTKGRYKLGAARMAKLFEMDMVPVALNSGEFWPRNSFLKYPGTIDVIIGKPISHQSGDEATLMAQCETWIESQQAHITGKGPCYQKPSA